MGDMVSESERSDDYGKELYYRQRLQKRTPVFPALSVIVFPTDALRHGRPVHYRANGRQQKPHVLYRRGMCRQYISVRESRSVPCRPCGLLS